MGIIVLLSIAVLCLLIWLNYFIAKQFEAAANAKGHWGSRFFHLCFWCGAIGYLLVIALPDRGKSAPTAHNAHSVPAAVQAITPKANNDELPDL